MKGYRVTSLMSARPRYTLFLLALVALCLQSCLGLDNTNTNFRNINSDTDHPIQINQTDQAVFKGHIYFTSQRNLYVIDGTRNGKQLTKGADVRDPAASRDGKWIAFIVRSKNYSDLVYMSTNGGPRHTVLSGNGSFYQDSTFIKSNYYWLSQPAWSPDGSHLIFLSDLQKEDWYALGGLFANAPFLDLQVFSVAKDNPTPNQPKESTQVVAYASFGDGGDSEASYRPGTGHPEQIVYTHFAYDSTGTNQVIQIFLEDATAIANHPGQYKPTFDPAVALTPVDTKVENLQPAFSPDGNALAYIRRQENGQMGLYVMPTPTEDVTSDPNNPTIQQQALAPYKKSSLILSGQFISQPVWSPDGKQIAYLAYNNNTFDIWLASINVDTKTGVYSMKGSPIQLTSGGIDGDSRPFWTP